MTSSLTGNKYKLINHKASTRCKKFTRCILEAKNYYSRFFFAAFCKLLLIKL